MKHLFAHFSVLASWPVGPVLYLTLLLALAVLHQPYLTKCASCFGIWCLGADLRCPSDYLIAAKTIALQRLLRGRMV